MIKCMLLTGVLIFMQGCQCPADVEGKIYETFISTGF